MPRCGDTVNIKASQGIKGETGHCRANEVRGAQGLAQGGLLLAVGSRVVVKMLTDQPICEAGRNEGVQMLRLRLGFLVTSVVLGWVAHEVGIIAPPYRTLTTRTHPQTLTRPSHSSLMSVHHSVAFISVPRRVPPSAVSRW